MITRKLPPKYISKARHWCVTWFESTTKGQKSEIQHVEFFITESEANERYKAL